MAEDRVERRLTTILAADVVGYSRLMAADEAGTLTSLRALRRELIEPKTAEYHGRVVKLMGDGTLMEFGSVVDAVTFAVDVQRAIALRNADVPEDQRIIWAPRRIARAGAWPRIWREKKNRTRPGLSVGDR